MIDCSPDECKPDCDGTCEDKMKDNVAPDEGDYADPEVDGVEEFEGEAEDEFE